MRKKRLFSAAFSMLLVFMIGFNTTAFAKAVAKPTLKIVTQPVVEYKVGTPITFVVTSANYSGKVEYRANIYNNTTKTTTELWASIPGYYNTKSKLAGNSKYTVSWPTANLAPGSYSIKVFVKRAGVKVSYDSFVQTTSFTIKPNKQKLDTKAISKNITALVLLKTYDLEGKEYGNGSGFIISKDGKVVTNYHVVDKATKIKAITHDGKEFDVTGIFNYDVDRDLAILNVKDLLGYPCLTMGDSNDLELGEEVIAIGSPMGLQNTVSTGIISSIRKNLIRDLKDCTDIQISAPISPGSSGGALFNIYGELVGVTFAGYEEGQNLNFAIPINEVKDLYKNINKESITLDVAMQKIYDQYDTENTKCSEFGQLLFQHYSTYDGKEKDYSLDMIDVYTVEGKDGVVYVDLIVHGDKYKAFAKPLDTTSVFKWVAEIEKEVIKKYPDKAVRGAVMLQEYFTEKPTDYPSDIIFEPEKPAYADTARKWAVELPFISFGANSEAIYCAEVDAEYNFQGTGYCIWADGDMYTGEWSKDMMNGKGVYVWSDGDMYEGEFVDGKMHGEGEYTYANGNVQIGKWNNDVYIGK